jgi:DNA polymerase Ligase (LigD)
MPRYVILEHDYPTLHWDLMLESGAVLKTWRLTAPPRPGDAVAAEPSFDHRAAYLDYEGPVSGGRGTVTRWDTGTFVWEEAAAGIAIQLHGARLHGRAVIEADGAGGWRLVVDIEQGHTHMLPLHARPSS